MLHARQIVLPNHRWPKYVFGHYDWLKFDELCILSPKPVCYKKAGNLSIWVNHDEERYILGILIGRYIQEL